jgi:hypothetical protein
VAQAGAVSAARSPAALEGEVRTRAALVPARFSAGVSAPSRRLPARVALRGLAPASLTPGARPRPAFAAPAPPAPGFGFAAARALEMAAVPAAFPLEAPDLPALAATGPGAAFRAALRLAPAALPLAVAVPGPGARCVVRGTAVLEAAVAAAPRRFGATLALLLPFAGASAVRALPAGGFAAALPRAGAPAGALAPFPAPSAARLAGFFLSSVGVSAIGSPRLVANVAPHHPRPLPARGQACGCPVQDRVARISWTRRGGLETGGVAELSVAQDGADPLRPLREAACG